MNANDLYDVLGLRGSGGRGARASTAEVQAAFRRELMKYHPDHQQGTRYDPAACSERTRQILAAYTVLRDDRKRASYDSGH